MAAKKIKRTITLAQRPKWTAAEPRGYSYIVLSLQNALEPAVGDILTPQEVAAMLDVDWTVNIKEAKS